MPLGLETISQKIAAGEVIADIGQLSVDERKALSGMARRGEIAKWRGKWFPIAGAPFGMGPDKTCFGLPSAREAVGA